MKLGIFFSCLMLFVILLQRFTRFDFETWYINVPEMDFISLKSSLIRNIKEVGGIFYFLGSFHVKNIIFEHF